jgi:asparagine synthase (glutamine-hydrolysing)
LYRFLILVWNRRDSTESDVAESLSSRLLSGNADWNCVHKLPGLRIYQTGARPGISDACMLPRQGGAILGTLFRKRPNAQSESVSSTLGDLASAKIIESAGQHLIDECWGRYVAAIHDASNGDTTILRDPSGALPCYVTPYKGIYVFFSNIEDCLRLNVAAFSVNWRFIAGLVCNHAQQLRETGLNEVSEVQPGEAVKLSADEVVRHFYWDPFRVTNANSIENASVAVKAFREVTQDCVHAWASRHDSIVHRLSGGLDSSIVASCLSTAPSKPSTVCLNYFGDGPQEDERRYARLVCAQAGFPLVEQKHDPTGVRLEKILNLAKSERPRFYIYSIEHGQFETQLARGQGATALFGGAGGDGLFYQNTAALAAVDYIHLNGTRPRLWKVALDAARIDRLSIWAVAWRAIAENLRDATWNPLEQVGVGKTFVNPAVVAAVRSDKSYAHPWLEESAGIPHGKLWHAMAISMPLTFYDATSCPGDAESVYPIMSQPLIELCLRLPTYVLIDSGWDRAIARRAFASDLPADIIKRRAKGSATTTAKKLFESNLGFIRELMLEGYLVRERLLDRKKLEKCLTLGRTPEGLAFGEILIEHLCTEAWLRSWQEPATKLCAVGN